MSAPLYKENQMPSSPGADGHRGLWFDRFFNQYDHTTWSVPQDGKKDWIKTVAGTCGDGELLQAACRGQESLCGLLGGKVEQVKTAWHFATGLGNPHPVENGFAWHPTLGVPFMSGAAVKGLVRAWVECWMAFGGSSEAERNNNRLTTLYRWFGSEDIDPRMRNDLREFGFTPPGGNDTDTEAGIFIFFDAIPVAPVKLACDIMTPHYGNWYAQGGEITSVATQPDIVPADWHSPVPVPFLVVKEGSYMFSIAPRRSPRTVEERSSLMAELEQVMLALTSALQYIGAGAKTAAGYGRMEVDEAARGRRELAAIRERRRGLDPVAQLREEIMEYKEERLATMFGRDFNKTHVAKKDNWDIFVQIVKEIHAATIASWENAQEKNKIKAYKRLTDPPDSQS